MHMRHHDSILPVFAGMVLRSLCRKTMEFHSPRIRGDGPGKWEDSLRIPQFSPYSRGWSQCGRGSLILLIILPVFAGMVRAARGRAGAGAHSPRIRGDGPRKPHPR